MARGQWKENNSSSIKQYDEISNNDEENTLDHTHIVTETLINASAQTQIDGFHKLERKFEGHIPLKFSFKFAKSINLCLD